MMRLIFILLFGASLNAQIIDSYRFQTSSSEIVYNFNWETYNTATDSWTFDNGSALDLNDGSTNGRFNRWTGSTPTGGSNIGPTSAQSGIYYVYTEASGSSGGQQFTATYDSIIDASTYSIKFEFYTNQNGDDNNATVSLQTNENGAGWVTRATFGGISDPTKTLDVEADVWTYRSVDLAGVVSNASTQIRLLVTLGTTGTISDNDYGLDNWTLTLTTL